MSSISYNNSFWRILKSILQNTELKALDSDCENQKQQNSLMFHLQNYGVREKNYAKLMV